MNRKQQKSEKQYGKYSVLSLFFEIVPTGKINKRSRISYKQVSLVNVKFLCFCLCNEVFFK